MSDNEDREVTILELARTLHLSVDPKTPWDEADESSQDMRRKQAVYLLNRYEIKHRHEEQTQEAVLENDQPKPETTAKNLGRPCSKKNMDFVAALANHAEQMNIKVQEAEKEREYQRGRSDGLVEMARMTHPAWQNHLTEA